MEIWKPIPFYEGIYEASNEGRIRTCEGKTTYTKRHGVRHWKQKILKIKFCVSSKRFDRKDGRVDLWKNGKHKTHLVARLVASAFYGSSKLTVNHIDGNPMNNNVSNLEYLSKSDNIKEGFRLGLYKKAQKETVIINKTTNEIMTFPSQSEAERYLGLHRGAISSYIKKGKTETKNFIIKSKTKEK